MLNFRQQNNVTKVEIPEFVRIKTGSLASSFPRMTSLKHVNINSKFLNNASYCFRNCWNLVSTSIISESVEDMSGAYIHCHRLVGNPVCGSNVVNMANSYRCCSNLKGNPVCGLKVTDMSYAYNDSGVTGDPVCGPNVTNMAFCYAGCTSLTGSPVCGNNVINMTWAYRCAYKLKPPYVIGQNVKYANESYAGGPKTICTIEDGGFPLIPPITYSNLQGNAYVYSSIVENAQNCFGYRNTNNMLNIYVPQNSTSLTTFLNVKNSIVEKSCEWTNDTVNNRYYNTQYNIYIYPVKNVAAAREQNGD